MAYNDGEKQIYPDAESAGEDQKDRAPAGRRGRI